ncbi:pentapeptide repeat-containing protein [Marinactinospora thermotolerans]|uniref:pentapeptide repeat-containing protein n=1 Tax=Marinactinospora thermotolerans TaxID=531310 RepID=UPI001F1F378F|nr:pentapeptide repeat-containing protein [Marinactinospora thermotolerans]
MPPSGPDRRSALRADCASCFGLCCVALPFAASADFALDKEAGRPCPNLREDSRCGIHSHLREKGFSGCTVFDCFGAGQKVSQITFEGRDWRRDRRTAKQMFAVFPVMRLLHELLRHLDEALSLPVDPALRDGLGRAAAKVERLSLEDAGTLLALDLAALHREVGDLLSQSSAQARAALPGPRADHRGADLIGARLRGADLRGADLRGSYLIAADLRDADLRGADLLGADLRDADLRGADLTGGVFLTGPQVTSAKGDDTTLLPASLSRPAHW